MFRVGIWHPRSSDRKRARNQQPGPESVTLFVGTPHSPTVQPTVGPMDCGLDGLWSTWIVVDCGSSGSRGLWSWYHGLTTSSTTTMKCGTSPRPPGTVVYMDCRLDGLIPSCSSAVHSDQDSSQSFLDVGTVWYALSRSLSLSLSLSLSPSLFPYHSLSREAVHSDQESPNISNRPRHS